MGIVAQRNFRKFISLRSWGWFQIIQRTRPLIGQPNPEEELRLLEEAAKNTYGAYDEQLKTKARLEEENVAIEEEKKALMAQLEKEQGNHLNIMRNRLKSLPRKLIWRLHLLILKQNLLIWKPIDSKPLLIKNFLNKKPLSLKRTWMISLLLFKSWSKKKLTVITQSTTLMMK